MKGLNLLFKDKLTIIIAALLLVTLIVCIPFVPMSAKYTTSVETESFNLKLASSKPVLRIGVVDYVTYDRPTFRQALGELMYNNIQSSSFESHADALDAVTKIRIVSDAELDGTQGEKFASGDSTVTESGLVDVYWNNGVITISAPGIIYSPYNSKDMFKGEDMPDKNDYGLSNLQEVEFTNLDTTQTIMMSQWFKGCQQLKGFDFNQIDISKVTNMAGFFSECYSIKTAGTSGCDVNFGQIDSSELGTWDAFFSNCKNLTRVDLSEFDTASVDNLSNFFAGCSKLTDITFGSNFVTPKVIRYAGMFQNCTSLQTVDLSSFTTVTSGNTQVTMANMFEGCSALQSLDLSTFNTSYTYLMNGMFKGCSSLASINFGSNFTTANSTNVSSMFENCSSLLSIDGLVLDLYKSGVYCDALFKNCSSLTEINFTRGFTKSVRYVNSMFEGCTGLTNHTIDLSTFDFSGVINHSKTFTGWLSGYDESSLIVIRPTAAGTWNSWLESPYNTSTGWPGVTFQ